MQQQRYGLNPSTGRVEHHYVEVPGDHRARPLLGHGRPTAGVAVRASGHGNVALGSGTRQISLGRAA